MSFLEKFNIFKKVNKKQPDQEQTDSQKNAAENKKPAESLESILQRAKQRMDTIKGLNKELKHAKKTNKPTDKIEEKIRGYQEKFQADFGLAYDANFDSIRKAIETMGADAFNERAGQNQTDEEPDVDNISPDSVDPVVDPTQANPDQTQPDPNQTQPDPNQIPEPINQEPAPELEYRRHLENLKIREGMIENTKYTDFETTRRDLYPDLQALVEALVAEKLKDDLSKNFAALALKTGLTEEDIAEIYKNNEEAIVAEAKDDINKNTSRLKSIGLAAGKSVAYIGAGIGLASMAATLGVSGLIGVGVVAGVRMIDRLLTEKAGKGNLDKKIKNVKANKSDEEKAALQDNLAASISLKKKIQINKVDLNAKPGRALLIDEYIEEQSQAGLLGLAPDKVMEYKDKMIRVMEGLDDIDDFNNKQEAKLNKKSISDVLAKVEKTVSGETAGERTASTAAFIGMGIAARELPLVRRILSAYTGYRLGALAADSFLQKKEKAVDPEVEERKKTVWYEEDYQEARRKLLDKNFQKNNPREYLELKERCDQYDNYMVSLGLENFSAGALNKDFLSKVKEDNKEARHFKLGRLAMRLGGAGLGLAGGELINELFKHTEPNKSAAGSASKTITDNLESGKTDKAPLPEQTNPAFDSTKAANQPESGALDSLNQSKGIGGSNLETPPSGKTSPDVETPPLGETSPDLEAGAPKAKTSAFEDLISNVDRQAGHTDSVWHSTNQIFKDHAVELGYKGDVKDDSTLEAWSQIQTAKAINNSGEVADKVFEGNKIVLNQDAQGNYHVEIEKGEGLTPGHLEHPIQKPAAPAEEATASKSTANQEIPPKSKGTDYDELNKKFIEKSKADFRAQHEFLYHDKYGQKVGETIIDSAAGKPDQSAVDSILFDRNPKPNPFGFEQDANSSSESDNSPAAVHETTDQAASGQANQAASVESGKGSGSDSEAAKSEGNKNAAENAAVEKKDGSRLYAKWDVDVLGEVETKKVFGSFDNFRDLANGTRTNLGEMIMVKNQDQYIFIEKDGETFKLEINEPGKGGHNDKFEIIRNNHVISGKDPDTAGYLKQMIYDNLPDKRTSLAKELLKEIARNKTEVVL